MDRLFNNSYFVLLLLFQLFFYTVKNNFYKNNLFVFRTILRTIGSITMQYCTINELRESHAIFFKTIINYQYNAAIWD